jgi:hypothetical protein
MHDQSHRAWLSVLCRDAPCCSGSARTLLTASRRGGSHLPDFRRFQELGQRYPAMRSGRATCTSMHRLCRAYPMPRGWLQLDERSSGRIRALLSTIIGWYQSSLQKRSLEVSTSRDLIKFPFITTQHLHRSPKNHFLQCLGLINLIKKSQEIFFLMR